MKSTSTLMDLFLNLKLDSLAWSLRRVHVPVKKEDLVLEVGSGANPYFRSNVLLDAYENTQERHWAPLVTDRPTVLGYVENLPFKDKVFDFVIASHVLEHSPNPEKFIHEIVRVSKAGYIEVPHAFMERLTTYYDHRLEIFVEDGKLNIFKKKNWIVDEYLSKIFKNSADAILSKELISKRPFHFHVRYYWKDSIDFKILNPEVDISWAQPQSTVGMGAGDKRLIARVKQLVLKVVRIVFSQNARNKKIELTRLVQCPKCKGELKFISEKVKCESCQNEFRAQTSFLDLR
jgi:SAM-dependent methyltransferase